MPTINTEGRTHLILLTPDEVVAQFAISYDMLNRWRRGGWIPKRGIIKAGKRGYLYTKDAIETAVKHRGHDRKWKNVEVIDG